MQNNPVNFSDPKGLQFDPEVLNCEYIYGETKGPIVGEPVYEETPIGFHKAAAVTGMWEATKIVAAFKKIPLPPVPDAFEKEYLRKYKINYTYYENRKKAYNVWKVCYDCCGNEISREPAGLHVTEEILKWIIYDYIVDAYIGDANTYNKRNVGPSGEYR